jgi:Protein of unknown function (DUF3309)
MSGNERQGSPSAQVEEMFEFLSGDERRQLMIILLILLFIFALGTAPTWSHSKNWGYYPSATLGTVLLIVIILLLLGVVPYSPIW